MRAEGHAPQALLLQGPAGTGRRLLALWHAAQALGAPAARFLELVDAPPPPVASDGEAEPERELVHPDFMLVRPPAEKSQVQIAQVRRLIDFLHLRSHRGGARVVVLWPAEAMNPNAAASLLKTLEEPPAGSMLVLVGAAASGLMPTVLSRCHKLRLPVPPRALALRWLASRSATAPWEELLDLATGAPLEALDLWRSGFADEAGRLADELAALRQRRATPVAVARRWAGGDVGTTLRWLHRQAVRDLAAETGNERLQNPGRPLNIRTRLERLREVEDLYRNRDRAMNVEAQFAALLQRWYGDTPAGRP
jgi:DNA polymerase-3 subunit delta'